MLLAQPSTLMGGASKVPVRTVSQQVLEGGPLCADHISCLFFLRIVEAWWCRKWCMDGSNARTSDR